VTEVRALASRVAPDLLGPAHPTGAWASRPWGFDDPGLARSANAPAVLLPSLTPDAKAKANTDAEHAAEPLSAIDAASIAEALHRRLTEARLARQDRDRLRQAIEEKKEEVRASRAEVESLRETLADLRLEARCDEDEGLPTAVERDRLRQSLEAERDRLDDALRKLAAGAPLAAFVAEVAETDADALPPRLDRLAERIGELQREAEEANQAIGRETAELARMRGNADAAEINQRAEDLRAKVKADVEQYTRLRLASAILRAGVERYRQKAQGPILARASATFARLTLGSFQTLRIDHDDRDEPVLRAIRPDGDALGVDQMSEGTADQLYLALRLATLDAFLDRHEPLPLIVDDILIQFDDARAAATLDVLAEFSQRTQVLLFTHHEHLVDLARARLAPDLLFPQSLPGRGT
jgi:uncharacterized protein YhaN